MQYKVGGLTMEVDKDGSPHVAVFVNDECQIISFDDAKKLFMLIMEDIEEAEEKQQPAQTICDLADKMQEADMKRGMGVFHNMPGSVCVDRQDGGCIGKVIRKGGK